VNAINKVEGRSGKNGQWLDAIELTSQGNTHRNLYVAFLVHEYELDSSGLAGLHELAMNSHVVKTSLRCYELHPFLASSGFEPVYFYGGKMVSSAVDITRLESLANTLAQGLESLLAEFKRRQDDESKQLSRYKCIAAQVCENSLLTPPPLFT
jgi:hypothetical protein